VGVEVLNDPVSSLISLYRVVDIFWMQNVHPVVPSVSKRHLEGEWELGFEVHDRLYTKSACATLSCATRVSSLCGLLRRVVCDRGLVLM
jgi:hypothetical protein